MVEITQVENGMAEEQVDKQPSECIEMGLSKLQCTLNNLQQTEQDEKNKSVLNTSHDNEDDKEGKDKDKDKHKLRKNRELGKLNDNQIVSARLRSESGRVYSSGVIINSAINTEQPDKMRPLFEGDSEESEDDSDNMACNNRKCCRNSAKNVTMIENLQKSVNDIQKSTSTQNLVSAGEAGDIRRIEDKTIENAKDIEALEKEIDDYIFKLKVIANVVIRQDQQIATLSRKINKAQQ